MLYVGYWGVSNGGHERHSLSSLRAEISAARHFRQPMQQRVELLPAFRIVVTKSGPGPGPQADKLSRFVLPLRVLSNSEAEGRSKARHRSFADLCRSWASSVYGRKSQL